jgi:DHHC palmitoyltransferase
MARNKYWRRKLSLFLAFVLSHTILSTYGTLMLCVLSWATTTTAHNNNNNDGGSKNNIAIVAIIVMISTMFSCLTVIHSTFHIMLVARGQTTNEYYKWKQLSLLNDDDASPCINSNIITGSQLEDDMEKCRHALLPQPPPPPPGGYLLSSSLSSSSSSARQQQQTFYNLGLVGNIHEVLFPRSLRRRDGYKKDS